MIGFVALTAHERVDDFPVDTRCAAVFKIIRNIGEQLPPFFQAMHFVFDIGNHAGNKRFNFLL